MVKIGLTREARGLSPPKDVSSSPFSENLYRFVTKTCILQSLYIVAPVTNISQLRS